MQDGLNLAGVYQARGWDLLQTVFEDGVLKKEYMLGEIRERIRRK
jgi:hypothetical protein